MKVVVSSLVSLLALGALVGGCAQKKAPPVARSAPKAPVVVASAEPPPGEVREKQPRLGEAAVYVDGKSVGVVRPTELPTGLSPRPVNVGGLNVMMRYSLGDYFRALGVDTKRIKALHLYGGKRVAVADKAEVARIGDRIMFSFSGGERGKPRIHWPPVKLHTNTTIDMLSNVAVYVEKEPPVLNERGDLVMPDGTLVGEKVPYAPEEQGNGTRVYVDGNLVGVVKRKKLTNEMQVAGADKGGEDRFSFLAYASSLNAKAKQAKAIDLVAGDDVIGQISSEKARNLTFNVPPRNRGQAVVDLPSTDGASQRARVSAVQIYVSSTPPSRTVAKLDDAPEAAIRTGQGGSGSEEEL